MFGNERARGALATPELDRKTALRLGQPPEASIVQSALKGALLGSSLVPEPARNQGICPVGPGEFQQIPLLHAVGRDEMSQAQLRVLSEGEFFRQSHQAHVRILLQRTRRIETAAEPLPDRI